MRTTTQLRSAWRRRKARKDDFDPEGVAERLEESVGVVELLREAEDAGIPPSEEAL